MPHPPSGDVFPEPGDHVLSTGSGRVLINEKGKLHVLNTAPFSIESEEGRTERLPAGTHFIAAPSARENNPILVSWESTSLGTVIIKARINGKGFEVEVESEGEGHINWRVGA